MEWRHARPAWHAAFLEWDARAGRLAAWRHADRLDNPRHGIGQQQLARLGRWQLGRPSARHPTGPAHDACLRAGIAELDPDAYDDPELPGPQHGRLRR